MQDKEKADCLIELHKTQMDHFKQTRDIEMKVNLGLWTFIIIAGAFIHEKVPLSDPKDLLIYTYLGIAIFVAHFLFWMVPIVRSQDMDDYFINEYRHAVEELTCENIGTTPPLRPLWFWNILTRIRATGWLWLFFVMGITALLLSIVWVSLSLKVQ